MKERFEIRARGKQWRVYDTKQKKYITGAIPEKTIAEEIADDFNKMHGKNFTPIGGPDVSKSFN